MYILWTSILAALIAQVLKLLLYFLKEKKLNFRRLVQTGGMPSAHTAIVSALATSVGLKEGFDSVLFSICTVFALIIMYDATNLRRAVGRQAVLLNKIMDEFHDTSLFNEKRLMELIGHTPKEVIAGMFLGIIVGYVFS